MWLRGRIPSGLQYFRARYYDPNTGWLNRLDPFAGNTSDPVSLHKYLYTHGNPVMGIDPTGLFAFSLGGCMAAGTIAGGLVGMSYGAYRGAMESGRLLSWKTLEYAGIGLVAGAAIGAATGAALYGAAAGLTVLGQSAGTMSSLFDLIVKAHGTRLPVFGAGLVCGLVLGTFDVPAATAVVTGYVDAESATIFALNQMARRGWKSAPVIGKYFTYVIRGTGKVTPFHAVRTTAFWATWFLADFTVGFSTSKAITWTTDQLTSYLGGAELAYGDAMEQEMAGAFVSLSRP